MKTPNTGGPDISAIINGLTDNKPSKPKQSNRIAERETGSSQSLEMKEYACRLWDEFMECLNDQTEDPEISRTKLYAIDDDIVETLHQCCLGKPNVHVINCILRTFLIDNIPRLQMMHRPRSMSLLDKYQIDQP